MLGFEFSVHTAGSQGRSFGFGDRVAGPKPPRAALVKTDGGERCGNLGTMIPAGTVERGGRRRRPMMRLTNLFCRDCCPDCVCNLYAAVAIPFDRAVGRRNAALAGTACDGRSTSTPRPGHRGPMADLSNGGEALRTKLNLLSLMA